VRGWHGDAGLHGNVYVAPILKLRQIVDGKIIYDKNRERG